MILRAGTLILLLFSQHALGARIGDIATINLSEQVIRFFSFQDPSVRYAVFGIVLLGLSCGITGSFVVVRKMALLGDTLSHAVLPGVALGFMWNMSKDPLAILLGATAAGILGTYTVSLLKRYSRIKEDAALGIVLSAFFAIGITLLTILQRLPGGNKSGIDKYLFGQAAAISPADLILIGIVTLTVLIAVFVFYKEFLVSSFDPGFARATGVRENLFSHVIMFLLAFVVVVSIQAVGVVLVSAMLITPASAAYLIAKRMHTMIALAALFGILSGLAGAFFSFLGSNLPTGPFMVVSASLMFSVAFFFAPRNGLLIRWHRFRNQRRRTVRENMLKAVFHCTERNDFSGSWVSDRRRSCE
jgi:manganese/zinc/iron transport system permease protein